MITHASAAVAKKFGPAFFGEYDRNASALSGREDLHAQRSHYELAGSHHASREGDDEGVAFIQHPEPARSRRDLKKTSGSNTDEDAERSYNSLLHMVSSLDVAPDPEAWKNIQRMVSRANPKVAQVDISQIITRSFVKTLKENGFVPELRKQNGTQSKKPCSCPKRAHTSDSTKHD